MRALIRYILISCMLALLTIGIGLTRGYAEIAQTDKVFNNASLKGIFVVANVGIGGQAPEGGVAVLRFNGAGQIDGANVQNLPGSFSTARRLVKTTVEGTYQVEENGTGTGSLTSKLTQGSTIKSNLDFAIAEARATNRFNVARELSLIVRELSTPTKNLITSVATKLPNRGEFSLASFKGTFAFRGFAPSNQEPAAGFGQITFDGKGKFNGFDVLNVNTGSLTDRTFIENPFEGTYTVDKDGIYTAFLANGGQAIFVMTKASLERGVKVAQEYYYIVPSQSTELTGGFFITSVGRKLPD